MPYNISSLPMFPAVSDMWEELKKEKRPIMVYGMGNGADKLFDRFALFDIKVSEIFASDGFVRGHSFRGYKVRSFSEIKAEYPDFVIVLSFASNREEVIDMLADIDKHYDVYVPDMPVAGVEEYFDKNFYNSNYKEILKAYERLDDNNSKAIFSSVINYKLSGRMKYLLECYSLRDEIYGLMPMEKIHVAIDAGAYNGDTAREMKGYFPNLETIYALEPDKKNFKKLVRYSEAENKINVIPINSAAWSENVGGVFYGSGNRNATAVATASFEHSTDEVKMLRIDDVTTEKVDYIKYDVEGAEGEALIGSQKTITEHNPTLLISLYHRSRDIFEIINMVREAYPNYSLYLRRLRCLPAWEIDLIAVNKRSERN
ncbi:MAG: FkbM family methyltransferase [Clostridia bacterium]|nr:FkbM family methyltransferase [Clostridia bacterium]